MPRAEILVVDSDAGIQKRLRAGLRQEGWRVADAFGAEEARKILDILPHSPDAMLIAWSLPEQNGLSLARELRKNPKWDQAVLALHGVPPDREAQCEVLESDKIASAYFTQPARLTEIAARLEGLLRTRRAAAR